ncbi:MAG: glycosyltransferase family 2 protein [Anaerolineaceae bacterium]|nr:glycosyltransferase family 2 protein [Anaerolineaceae bacterium]
MEKLAILMTSHNRKDATLSSLQSVQDQKITQEVQKVVFLADSQSTDGTALEVSQKYPHAQIISCRSNVYWNSGMRIVFAEALKRDFEYYLWLNDDTILFEDTIERLIQTAEMFSRKAIIVGSTKDPESGQWSYGGVIRKYPKRPLHFSPVIPGEIPIPAETMNGNIVLISREVVGKVGNLDPAFSHAIGDFDYGLRAQKLGVRIFIAPEYHGYCKRNVQTREEVSFIQRAKNMLSKKGLPPVEWARFAKRYAGKLWFLYWLSPYSKIIMTNSNKYFTEG